MEVIKAIQNRKSVRKFSSKKTDWRDVIECVDAARYAPMAGGNFSLKFIIVDDAEKIEKLSEAAQQNFVNQTSHVIVVCSVPSRTVNAYGDQGEVYVRQQAGAAIQNILLAVEEKKMGACWVGYFVEGQVRSILGIPEDAHVEALIPVGYASEARGTSSKKKSGPEMDRILYFNKWKEKRMKPLKGITSA